MSTPKIERFDAAHLDAVVDCVTSTWITDNVIARALGVTDDDYRPVAKRICAQALADDMGLMLREPATDRIVGFYSIIDLVDELAIEQTKVDGENPRIRRWAALLGRGLQWYIETHHYECPLERGEVIYFNIGGTVAEYRGRGWINRMTVMAVAELAIPRGYRRLLGIATHPHAVNMTRMLSHGSGLHEIRFEDSGDPDLERITDPPCALLSITPLFPGAEERIPTARGGRTR